MANLFDYLKSKGHLSFEEAPFNHVDSLILSRLSYLPFEEIVPTFVDQSISIEQAAELFFTSQDANKEVIMRADPPLLENLVTSKRFAQLQLSGYVNQIDLIDEKQFAALVIRIHAELVYISYRGTDLSLAGWKEDFNMSFSSAVPSQKEAVDYLNHAATKLKGKFILGGHSKGGNLAVYAGAFCRPDVQERVLFIYNNDGPGFNEQVLSSEGYQRVAKKIKTFVPQSSIVGMLLQHETNYSVIYSKQIGLMQHDLFSWQIEGDDFVYLDQVTEHSRFIDQTLKTWLMEIEPEEREEFFDTLFAILVATEATTLVELTANWYTNARILLKSFRDLDEEMRQKMQEILNLLFEAAKQNLPFTLPKPELFKHLRDRIEKMP